MDTLAADAPRLIFAMLHELLAKRGPSGGEDAVGDAGRLTEEDVRASYAKLNVNTAELLGARARSAAGSRVFCFDPPAHFSHIL